MKNITLVICALIFATPLFGQIPKGSSTLGGNVSVLRQSTTHSSGGSGYADYDYHVKLASITPTYGYFVVNNLCVGANVNTLFTRAATKPNAGVGVRDLKSDSRSIGVGPMLRYYVPLDSKLYAFATTSYSWMWSQTKQEYIDDPARISTVKNKSTYTLWDAGLGLSYFVSPSTAVEAGFTYTKARYEDEGGNLMQKANQVALNIGFRIFLRKE